MAIEIITDRLMTDNHCKPLLSPLRYPGSKRRLSKYIQDALELNKLHPTLYVEPFAGGASVALHMLQLPSVEQVILMDLDPWITSFWQTLFSDTDWLIEQVQTIEVTVERWQQFKHSHPVTEKEQALAGFFLNRTSFSGILEAKAGPIGGQQQKSSYKIDCRFPRETLIRRIQQIAAYKNKIYGIWNCSWEAGIARLREEQQTRLLPHDGLFFYFDPPFFEKAETLYRYYFAEKDHLALRDFLLTLEDKWILSYDFAQQVEALYGEAIKKRTNGARQHHLELSYTLGIMSKGQKQGKEVIISNLANLPDFAKI